MATSAQNWKKPELHELKLPSGNVCLLRRPGMEKLLAAGVLPDSLTPIAIKAIEKAQSGGRPEPEDRKRKKGEKDNELDPEMMKEFLEKEGALEDIFAAFDKVTAMVVEEPQVEYHMRQRLSDDGQPLQDTNGRAVWEVIPRSERSEEILYTDDVDADDKSFIFEFVAGGDPRDDSFPDAGDDVADVQSKPDVPVPTKRASRAKKQSPSVHD